MIKHSTRNPVGVTPLGIVMAITGPSSLTKSSQHGCLSRYHTLSKRPGMILHSSSLECKLPKVCHGCCLDIVLRSSVAAWH